MPTADMPWYILRIHIAPRATSYVNTAANARERSSAGDVKRVKRRGARLEPLPFEIFFSAALEQCNVVLYFAKYLLWEFEKFTPYSRCVDVGPRAPRPHVYRGGTVDVFRL